jgi:hypothetical protein
MQNNSPYYSLNKMCASKSQRRIPSIRSSFLLPISGCRSYRCRQNNAFDHRRSIALKAYLSCKNSNACSHSRYNRKCAFSSTYFSIFIPQFGMLTRKNFTIKNRIIRKSFNSSHSSANFRMFIQWNATFLERM